MFEIQQKFGGKHWHFIAYIASGCSRLAHQDLQEQILLPSTGMLFLVPPGPIYSFVYAAGALLLP